MLIIGNRKIILRNCQSYGDNGEILYKILKMDGIIIDGKKDSTIANHANADETTVQIIDNHVFIDGI